MKCKRGGSFGEEIVDLLICVPALILVMGIVVFSIIGNHFRWRKLP